MLLDGGGGWGGRGGCGWWGGVGWGRSHRRFGSIGSLGPIIGKAGSLAAVAVLHQWEALKRRLQKLPFVRLWWEFGELWAGVVAGGHRRGGDGNGQRAEAVLAGAERAAPPGDARRRRAGRSVGGARRAAEIPVVAAHWGGLQVQGVVDEDLRGPLRHRGRCVRKRVPWRRWRRAGQRAIARGPVVDGRSGLVPGKRRGQPGWDGRGAVGPGAQLTQKRTESESISARERCYCSHFGLRHGVLPSGRQRRGLQQLLAELVQAAAGHRLEPCGNKPTAFKTSGCAPPPQTQSRPNTHWRLEGEPS